MTDANDQIEAAQAEWAWIARPIVSLSFPQFRLFWFSNLIVATGLMVQFTAQGWLVANRLSDSALVLGAVEGTWAVTFGLGSIPMGMMADRFNRRNLLIGGNAVALSTALIMGLLVFGDRIAIWHVFIASGIGGLLFAIRFPAGQAITARLVPQEHLMNAISLNTVSHSLPNVAGPAVGGVLIGALGIAAAYFLTSGAFSLALLMMLGVAAAFGHVQRKAGASAVTELRQAYDYLLAHKDLLQLTGAMLIPFILGQSYVLLLALFVEQELHGGPETFGALSASLGAGSAIGAMAVAAFGRERQIGLLMFMGVLGVGICGIAYGLSQWVVVTGGVLLVAGAAQSALFAAYETLLLLRLPDEMRGRVIGLMFTVAAMFPIGAIAAGAIADVIGLRALAVIEGTIVIFSASVAWRAVLRNVETKSKPA
jgi:MFS family permease